MHSRDIDIQILIARPIDKVFEAWVKPELLEQWLARKARVEAAPGGAYELFWDPENPGVNSTLGCTISSIVPNAELSFNWKGPERYAEIMGDVTKVFVRMERQGGGTLLRFVHTGWGKGARWEEARLWQANAWKQAIENLKNYLETSEKLLGGLSMN
ncbi:MAG: SRPBCC domain-containing protein [Elusimicrobia bacterium]|nr:SRPBCC domain-containing protein [Elusimicrobiota bacterium]